MRLSVTVVAFTTERAGWFANSRRIATARTTADGRYFIRNLPIGEYRIVATTDREPGEWFDPAALDRLSASGTPFKITGADKLTLDLQHR